MNLIAKKWLTFKSLRAPKENAAASAVVPAHRHKRKNADPAKKGVAAIEFALSLPIWITLLLGVADGSYFLLINEKADRIAYTVTDVVTQNTSITKSGLDDIFSAAGLLMNPFSFANNGTVVVSSFYYEQGQQQIALCWNYSSGTNSSTSSDIGIRGNTLYLPNGETLTLNANENIIVSEVYYTFTPMFLDSGLFKSGKIYRMAVYKPRLSLLINSPS